MFTNTKGPVIIIVLLLGLFLAAAWFGYNKLSTDITDPLQAFQKTALLL